jgi:hypothetical protein
LKALPKQQVMHKVNAYLSELQGIHVILLAISVVCTFHKLTHIISSVIC